MDNGLGQIQASVLLSRSIVLFHQVNHGINHPAFYFRIMSGMILKRIRFQIIQISA